MKTNQMNQEKIRRHHRVRSGVWLEMLRDVLKGDQSVWAEPRHIVLPDIDDSEYCDRCKAQHEAQDACPKCSMEQFARAGYDVILSFRELLGYVEVGFGFGKPVERAGDNCENKENPCGLKEPQAARIISGDIAAKSEGQSECASREGDHPVREVIERLRVQVEVLLDLLNVHTDTCFSNAKDAGRAGNGASATKKDNQ